MPIKILDEKVISRIAAGEVVERPASVVKELVENALDAGATQIAVEIAGGGTNLIRITDNGSGIPGEELALAFERHATSKVASLQDLESIKTLGFRGEALPSIASVAEVEVTTCAAGHSNGAFIRFIDGLVTKEEPRGRSQGTTVTVRHLFRKVPARLKFLKSMTTENARVAELATHLALAYPEVKFSLSFDGKSSFLTPGSGRLLDSIAEVYGLEMAQQMLPVDGGEGRWSSGVVSSVNVTGMAGSPQVSRAGRERIVFFVNRRLINSRTLSFAVEQAYHGLLMEGRHPAAVLNITLPPEDVDVNIHPAKTEVKFRDESVVFSAVQKAVRQALVKQMPVPRIEETAARRFTAGPPVNMPISPLERVVNPRPDVMFEASPTLKTTLPLLRVIGQAAACYIVAEGPDGVYIIDQHAAHERILFEKLQRERTSRKVEAQGLLEPATFEVEPRQDVVLKLHYQELTDFGFTLEPFGERTYLVRTVPALLEGGAWSDVLLEVLESSAGSGWTEKMVESLACHGAVRSGKVMSDIEMSELVQQLEQTELPQTCPHGRPTLIHLSRAQLEKEFGRI